jgi:hypothetical protein
MMLSNGPARRESPGPWPTPVAEVSTVAKSTLSDRFWSKVDKSGDCWLWTGGQNRNGYGLISFDGRHEVAHRTAWRLSGRILDPSLTLDHLCRVRTCVRPDHLQQVSMRENLMRGNNFAAEYAKRDSCSRGHPYTEANTRYRVRGKYVCRECRQCDLIRWRKALSRESDR